VESVVWACNSNAASNGPLSPLPNHLTHTAKTCQGGGGEEEMAGKGGNTIHPHTFQFSSQHSESYGTLYEELPSAFVKIEEKQRQRKRHKNSL